MGYRWVVQPDGTFNDGLHVWDFVRIRAEDYDPGTKLVLGRPRLGRRMTIAIVISDLKKGLKWNELREGSRSRLHDVLEYRTDSLPFQAGDELELLEESSSTHALS